MCLSILGIELDSIKLQACLPQDKFKSIVELLDSWSKKHHCKREESLIGNIHHACKVAPQGRTFLRRMINLLSAFRRDDHPIHINQEFRLDLKWWQELFESWTGYSLPTPRWALVPDFQVSSDASRAIGFGAILGSHWFTGTWNADQMPLSIAYKELFPVVILAALWGPQWVSRRVLFRSDNQAVVDVLRTGTSKDRNMMVLLRFLSLLAHVTLSVTSAHVEDRSNSIADALFRFQFQKSRQLVPQADQEATEIPMLLLNKLSVV